FPDVPVALVPNALDLQALSTLNVPAEGAAAGSKDLLFLGRLAVEHKGLDLLLRAYRLFLNRSGDTESRLLMVGPDHRGGRGALQGLVRQLGLEQRVALREPVFGQDKWRLLASS